MVKESKLKGLHIFWALFYDYAAAVRDSFEVFFQDSNKVRIKLRSEKYPVPSFSFFSLSFYIPSWYNVFLLFPSIYRSNDSRTFTGLSAD